MYSTVVLFDYMNTTMPKLPPPISHVRLGDDLQVRLALASRETGLNASQIMRLSLAVFLEKHPTPEAIVAAMVAARKRTARKVT